MPSVNFRAGICKIIIRCWFSFPTGKIVKVYYLGTGFKRQADSLSLPSACSEAGLSSIATSQEALELYFPQTPTGDQRFWAQRDRWGHSVVVCISTMRQGRVSLEGPRTLLWSWEPRDDTVTTWPHRRLTGKRGSCLILGLSRDQCGCILR